MYRVTCDGFPLLDWRDNDLVLAAAKLRLEVNTVGDGSFTIYDSHPYFDKLARLRSVIEVSDETGVIFRGRATGDSIDFDNGMDVDMEGALAYFNDSLVRPFSFPGDFLQNADYIAAEESGNVIAFFLGWLIDNHNAQVEDFQKLKLGNVTVTDPNNYISRSSSDHASTWDTLRGKLFESSLGGYLCIRYEADGNYIDYLSEFTETNSQEIAFGENLLDLTREAEASGIYTAMLPVGALGLTIANLDDGDWSEDIVKSGDTVYSRKAVAQYGWIYAPVSESTWEDVTQEINLLTKAAERLGGNGALLSAVEATAVDLHFTDAQIESLRIYKNVKVHSAPHGLSEIFPLSKLEIDLIDPKRTKITVGKRLPSWTEIAALREEEAKINFSRLSKTDSEIMMEVSKEITALSNGIVETLKDYSTRTQTAEMIADEVSKSIDGKLESYSTRTQTAEAIKDAVKGFINGDEVSNSIETALDGVKLEANSADGSTVITLTGAGTKIKTTTLDITVKSANINGKLTASQIETDNLKVKAANITGTLTLGQLPDGVASLDDLLTESDITIITENAIRTASISANQIAAGLLDASAIVMNGIMQIIGEDAIGNTAIGYVGANPAKGAVVLASQNANVACMANNSAAKLSYHEQKMMWVHSGGCYSSETVQVYSDRTLKNAISYDLAAEKELFKMLRPCSFVYNNDQDSKKHWGFIAQDFIQSAEDVGMDAAALAVIGQYDGKYSLGYGEVTALNTLMIQDVIKRLDAMEKVGN